jgi:hypothetical protein
MVSTASDLIKFEKQATGENSATWGTKANTAMSRIEEAIAGYRAITVAGSTYTLDDTQYLENSTTTAESHLSFIKCTGTPGAARLIAIPARTKHYTVWNAVTTYDITFGISGNVVVTVPTGHIVNVFCDGTNTYATSPLLNTTGQITYEKGGDISSASPTVIDTDGHMFDVTGTTGFSAFTVAAERLFVLQFDDILTMTHGAGTLDLLGGANITTAAGDTGLFYSTAANVVRMLSWNPVAGFSDAQLAESYSKVARTITADTSTALNSALTHEGGVVTMNNASANVFTIEPNATIAHSTGAQIDVIQLGAGVTSITGDTGVTLNGVSAGTGAMTAQYGAVTLLRISSDVWTASGAIGTVA